jgi:hypothetical protein
MEPDSKSAQKIAPAGQPPAALPLELELELEPEVAPETLPLEEPVTPVVTVPDVVPPGLDVCVDPPDVVVPVEAESVEVGLSDLD